MMPISTSGAAIGALAFATLFLFNSPANALGTVSRSCAPFGAQESVTVDWLFQRHTLWTSSSHYRNGIFLHTTTSNGWESTWRSYAGHLGSEFWYGRVIGAHYISERGVISFLGNSYATDCNLREWSWLFR